VRLADGPSLLAPYRVGHILVRSIWPGKGTDGRC